MHARIHTNIHTHRHCTTCIYSYILNTHMMYGAKNDRQRQ